MVVLGASDNPQRYSNMALKLLCKCGHKVIPVHPRLKQIEGIPVTQTMDEIDEEVDTLTLYVGPLRSKVLKDTIISLKPKRVIFNPGSESPELEEALTAHDICFLKACTLVMLHSGQF